MPGVLSGSNPDMIAQKAQYKFRLYPNKEQKILIKKSLGCARYIYNHFLAKAKEDEYKTYNKYSKQLTQLKKEFKWLKEAEKKDNAEAEWYGRKIIKIDTFFASSQLCNHCGCKNKKVKDLKVRKWKCPNCGEIHDRDINASKNILKEGLKMQKAS